MRRLNDWRLSPWRWAALLLGTAVLTTVWTEPTAVPEPDVPRLLMASSPASSSAKPGGPSAGASQTGAAKAGTPIIGQGRRPNTPAPLQDRIDDAIKRAKEYLFTFQSDKILLVVGDETSLELWHRVSNKLHRIEVEGDWSEVKIDRSSRSVIVAGRVFRNVHLVMPPGWFGPSEFISGEPYDIYNGGAHTALFTVALLSAGADPVKDPRMKAAMFCLLNFHHRELGHLSARSSNPSVAAKGTGATPASPSALTNGPIGTYALGLRGQALEQALQYVRAPADRRAIIAALQRDARLLANGGSPSGGFHYYMLDPKGKPSYNDTSMSRTQYGLLGLWAAAMVPEVRLPTSVWPALNQHLLDRQHPSGGWAYGDVEQRPSLNMTAAGLTGLLLVTDHYFTRTRGARGPDITPIERNVALSKTLNAIDRGMDYLANGYKPRDLHGYGFYGIERVATAGGYKYFNNRDWFREGLEIILRRVQADGCIADLRWIKAVMPDRTNTAARETAWNLLFLVHGSAPVLVNKLRYGDRDDRQWNNYPRDAANLARWHQRNFEQETNWQVVSLDGSDEDLLDAPILLMTGYRSVEFSAEQQSRLRRYLLRGGTLLAVACGPEGAARPFTDSVAKLIKQMFPAHEFPEYRLAPLPTHHPVREDIGPRGPVVTVEAQPKPAPGSKPGESGDDGDLPPPQTSKPLRPMTELKIRHVHNGHRSFIFLVDEDLAYLWHSNAIGDEQGAFRFLGNLKRYCTDKSPLLPKHYARSDPMREVEESPDRHLSVRVGAAQYKSLGRVRLTAGEDTPPVEVVGDWNSAEIAWADYTPWFKRATGIEIALLRGVKFSEADPGKLDVLHMVGHYRFELSAAEKAGLKRFLAGGGTLFLEQMGGRDQNNRGEFAEAAEQLARELFPDAKLAPVPAHHYLVTGAIPPPSGAAPKNGWPTGFNCQSMGVTRAVALRTESREPLLRAVLVDGRAALILSPLDVSCALTGQTFLNREGYSGPSARQLLANILLAARLSR